MCVLSGARGSENERLLRLHIRTRALGPTAHACTYTYLQRMPPMFVIILFFFVTHGAPYSFELKANIQFKHMHCIILCLLLVNVITTF